ncbi:hypothetical protein V1520DRAFT_331982 [Lipomyces starkeyi]|uniref:MAP kinase kinase kinase n=1 Tax=Lipomyces starkeyi NRRL Y-11557 TaxID=675824 RepID=A0A1E3Q2U3_LIPST|nr:hypothetical protein LIPSTDRAFT_313974 [Lipomyces starkeyi NRRL Y-11557]
MSYNGITAEQPPSPKPEPVSLAANPQQQPQAQSAPQRPQTIRVPSNTYAPARKPQLVSETSRKNRSSSNNRISTRKQQQKEKQHNQLDQSSHGPRATDDFEAQQKFYLKKMRDDLDDEYYTRGISQYDSEADDDSTVIDYPVRTDFQTDVFDSDFVPPIAANLTTSKEKPSPDELENPKNRERLEWQTMLSAVLTGEVVKSEKRKLQTGQTTGKLSPETEFWLEIRAKVCGRSLALQRKILEDSRKDVDQVIDELMNFQIQGKDECPYPPDEQIKNILRKVEKCESLYRCTSAMREDKPVTAHTEFQSRCEALISWVTISGSIHSQVEALKKWTGNDDLDLTRTPDKTENTASMSEPISFIERIFKESDIAKIFETKILATLGPLIAKAKQTTIEQGGIFAQMHLPSYLEELLILLNFPTRLIQEIIRTRLVYARKLMNPTMMMIDQMIDVFKVSIQLAVDIKKDYFELSAPEPGWELPTVIDENFDYIFLDGLSFYLELLHRKLLGGAKGRRYFKAFREAEFVEGEWNYLKDVGRFVEGADLEIAEQFSLLTGKLLQRLTSYFERQLKGPPVQTESEIDKWYNTTIDHVRGFHRKLLRFSRILENRFENTSEYAIDAQQIPQFIRSLIQTGHFLIYSGKIERDDVHIVADPSLADRLGMIREMVRAFSREEIPENDTTYSYLLFICPQEQLVWDGPTVNLDLPDLQLDLKPGRLRLVADGSVSRLLAARSRFTNAVSDICSVVVEQRAFFPRIDRELQRIRKTFYKLAMLIITSVDTVRSQCKGIGCQEMVNHYFIFAREVGQRAMRYLDSNRRAACALKLVLLSIDWVSFVCDDCVATDKKTFQWSVNALEFAMMMTKGVNILTVSDEEFSRLRLKVAGCMTLLISHFDIMGARSSLAAALEQKQQEKTISPIKEGERDDEDSIKMVKAEWMKELATIEESRRLQQEEQRSVGKVLDDSNSETQYLMFLTSSFTNVSLRWQQGRFIGGGTFGSVYAAVNLETGDVMAVKEIRLQDTQSIRHIVKSIKDEMTVLEMLNHPNIVQYYGVEVHREKVFIFMEYCQGGSLASLLEHGRIEDETVSQVYTLQMLEGLAYLHEAGIVHRDIKPENILLDHLGVIKFVDFGAAKVIAQKGRTRAGGETARTNLNSMTGTPMYMSPEVITGSGTGRHGSVDIWSMGCCVLEMATGRRPWANLDNEWAIMYHIAAGHQPSLPSADLLSEAGQQFLLRCFERDPYKRASAIELLDDPWIRSIKMETLAGEPQTPSTDSETSSRGGI